MEIQVDPVDVDGIIACDDLVAGSLERVASTHGVCESPVSGFRLRVARSVRADAPRPSHEQDHRSTETQAIGSRNSSRLPNGSSA